MKRALVTSRSEKKIIDILFLFSSIAAAVILFDQTHYGIVNGDEALYLSLPLRFLQGDAMLVDEWNLSQLFSVFLMLPMKIFIALKGESEGIVLWFRLLYTLSQCIMAVFIYLVLRKKEPLGAALAALIYMIFAPNGIMALSYITLGNDFMLLALLALYADEKGRMSLRFIAGLLFAAAVLCWPHLALGYLLYVMAAAAARLMKRPRYCAEKTLAVITCACALGGLAFLAFILCRSSVSQLLQSLPYVMNDAGHSLLSADKLLGYFKYVYYSARLSFHGESATQLIYILMGVLAALCLNKGLKRERERERGAVLFTAACVLSTALLLSINDSVNYTIWPISLLAVFPMLLGPDDYMKRVFRYIWLPGMLYTYFVDLSSDQQFYAIAFSSAVPAVGSVLIIVHYLRRGLSGMGWKKSFLPLLLACTFGASVLFLLVDWRTRYVYFTSSRDLQTTYIDCGHSAGLLTTPEMAYGYDVMTRDMNAIRDKGLTRLMIYSGNKAAYLTDLEFENCSYSVWQNFEKDPEAVYRSAMAYLEVAPDKFPEAVFIDDLHYDQRLADHFQKNMGYACEKLISGTLLYKTS